MLTSFQGQQKCYKRVTLSCHIAYLALDESDTLAADQHLFDRSRVFPFQQENQPGYTKNLFIVRASSSVLLTLAIPEESVSREEEINLLRNPQALWIVLTANCPVRFGSEYTPAEHSTPIAQFVRGVTAAVRTQTLNAQSIYDRLSGDLHSGDLEGLFDDERFTKSNLYHRVVKTCEELEGSIAASLRFMKRAFATHLTKLCAQAHAYETVGVDYWVQQLEDEMFALEELQAQISLLCSQVREKVSSSDTGYGPRTNKFLLAECGTDF
jgi:hypothetical protein